MPRFMSCFTGPTQAGPWSGSHRELPAMSFSAACETRGLQNSVDEEFFDKLLERPEAFSILAQESFSGSVRLKTSFSLR